MVNADGTPAVGTKAWTGSPEHGLHPGLMLSFGVWYRCTDALTPNPRQGATRGAHLVPPTLCRAETVYRRRAANRWTHSSRDSSKQRVEGAKRAESRANQLYYLPNTQKNKKGNLNTSTGPQPWPMLIAGTQMRRGKAVQ